MKTFIPNRHGKKICVVVEQNPQQRGLVFVMHGLGGSKDQISIRTYCQTFVDNGFTVVSFDATHTYGESEGDYADATVTNYYQDLEDVISWAKTQVWYQEPFWLVGSSLGALSSALYAEKYPSEVKALAPISVVVSGKLSAETYNKDVLAEWKRTGWLTRESGSKPGFMKHIKYSEFEDRQKYDLLPEASKLTMPVFMLAGTEDVNTPLKHQQFLYDLLPGKKELHIIQGAPHTLRDRKYLDEAKSLLDNWIKNILNNKV